MATIARVPYFICPNCKERSIDHDRREGLTQQAVSCHHCGFGFLFELAQLALEWGVRRLGEQLDLRTRVGHSKPVTADFFPAYDDDGGLLVAITPR